MNDKLTNKKVDIIAYSVITALMLALAASFYNDVKKDPENRTAKFMTGLSLVGTCMAGCQSGIEIKKYRDIKKELSKKAKEKQK